MEFTVTVDVLIVGMVGQPIGQAVEILCSETIYVSVIFR